MHGGIPPTRQPRAPGSLGTPCRREKVVIAWRDVVRIHKLRTVRLHGKHPEIVDKGISLLRIEAELMCVIFEAPAVANFQTKKTPLSMDSFSQPAPSWVINRMGKGEVTDGREPARASCGTTATDTSTCSPRPAPKPGPQSGMHAQEPIPQR